MRSLAHRGLTVTLATLLFWWPIGPSRGLAQREPEAQAAVSEPAESKWSAAEFERGAGLSLDRVDRSGSPSETSSDEVSEAVRDTVARDFAEIFGSGPGTNPPGREGVSLDLPNGPGKSAVTAQSLALPKGEGSIEGMGESFTTNLSSGTGTFGLPVVLPRGRNGVQPSLALSYSTSGGNGIVGFGWSMAVPFISRQTDKGLPRYVDRPHWHGEEDTFIYNGGQELVPVDNGIAQRVDGAPVPAEFAGFQQYRARIEGSFMRFFRSPDSRRWVVQSKDGTRFDFGATDSPGPRDALNNSAVQADPEDATQIFSWQLVRVSDAHGSAIHYQYFQNGGTPYLSSIHYTSPAACAAVNAPRSARECTAPLSDYAHRVGFVYESRKDVTTSYVTSWRVEQALRLKRIEVTSAGAGIGFRSLVRRYWLAYDSLSYHSLLKSVQVEGRPSMWDDRLQVFVGDDAIGERVLSDRVVGDLLPAMEFGYSMPPTQFGSIAGFGGFDATVHESAMSPDHSMDESRADLFDVNADGLPDLLVTDPVAYDGGVGVHFNGFSNGAPSQPGSFSAGVRVSVEGAASDVLNLGSLNVVPMDVDGDGRSDVLNMPRTRDYGYFVLGKPPASSGEAYAPTEGWSFYHVANLLPRDELDPRIDLGKDGAYFKTLDVNNDHLIDLVRTTGQAVQTWLNLGHYPGGQGRFGSASFAGTRWKLSTLPVESCLLYAGKNLDFSAEDVRIADMNGDGLQDIVRATASEVIWWPGRGAGLWGEGSRECSNTSRNGREVRMADAPRGLSSDLSGVHFVDVNEDGASDLVQLGKRDVSVWFNQGGAGFTERLLVRGTPEVNPSLSRERIADIDGSSTVDIVYGNSGRYRWIDFMGGRKPRLLTSVQNGLGAMTTLEYSSSVADYLRDLSESRACQRGDLECFTWQRDPLLPGEERAACDAHVYAKSGLCAHRSSGSPVVSSVVRRVKTSDRLDVLGASETVSETEYRYHDGYYEGIEQEFRGFGAADAISVGDANEPTSITRTHFHQGRRPNDIATDRLADNPNEALKGREFLTEVHDERGVYLTTRHATYAVRNIMTGLNGVAVSYAYAKASDEYRYDTALESQRALRKVALPSVTREQARAGLSAVIAAPAEAGDAAHPVIVRHTGYALIQSTIDEVDNLGHTRKQTAWGRNGRGEYGEPVADERIVQHMVPVRVDDALCGGTSWLWRTQHSYISGADDAVRYGDTVSSFTPCGDLRSTTRAARLSSGFNFSAQPPAATYVQGNSQELASVDHDAWGQTITLCGGVDPAALGYGRCLRLSTIAYDEAYEQLVVSESVATGRSSGVPSFLTSSATWDRGLDALRKATDPNGMTGEVFYDGHGRLTSTLLPNVGGCEGARVPTVRIAYDVTLAPATRPLSRVTTTRLLACAGQNHADNQLISHAYVDGLGRVRTSLAEGDSDPLAFDDGRAHPWTLSGYSLLNKKGHAFRTYQPAYFDGDPADYSGVLGKPATPYQGTVFDAFGRPRVESNEDFTFRTRSYHALSADLCDEVDNGFGAEGDRAFVGTCATERTDGHGRSVDQQLRQRTLDGRDEQHRLFTYYRPDGAAQRVVRGLTGNNVLRPESGYTGLQSYVERRFHYDTLGRRVASEDPDTDNRAEPALAKRTWRYLFNPVGDLVAVRDPRGCGQNFYYDLAGRLIGEAYAGCAEAQAGELPSAELDAESDVPTGSVALGLTTAPTSVHVRYSFDAYPAWAEPLVPSGLAGVLAKPTAVSDRGQRSAVGYDERGNPVWAGKQLAVIADEVVLSSGAGSDGRPQFGGENESAVDADQVVYDSARIYVRTATFDHAGRSVETSLPTDPDFSDGAAPVMRGRLRFHRGGAPRSADMTMDGVRYPIVDLVTYTRDGLPFRTRFGDRAFTNRAATESTVFYDGRRRPTEMITTRTPAAGRTAGTLGAVYVVANQRLSWDGASNLFLIEDRRNPGEWPTGHKPATQRVRHDALYRVAQVDYAYSTPTQVDQFQDWRDEEERHRPYDPMRPKAAPSVTAEAPDRVMSLGYSHDWLANMVSWDDDAHQFYERSLGRLANGNALSSGASPAHRPAALYLANNLDPTTASDLGGWLEMDYGQGGNLLAMTVHARCTNAGMSACQDVGSSLEARRSNLRSGCACAVEQHYVYRWDELNRLHEARRYDRAAQGPWTIAARQRYRYDSGNRRTVKQSFDVESGGHRAALFVLAGDFERRGLEVGPDGDEWLATSEAESQYMIGGARVVWKSRVDHTKLLDSDHRITFAIDNLIQSTSAVIELLSGELVEAGGFYPNGAREEWVGASDELGGAQIPLEPAGFTSKEADEEVGLAYFGERYLVARIGSWATPDPLHIGSMGGGEPGNSYHYVSGNLLQARDPLGLCGDNKSCGDGHPDANTSLASGEAVRSGDNLSNPDGSTAYERGPEVATTRALEQFQNNVLVHARREIVDRLRASGAVGSNTQLRFKISKEIAGVGKVEISVDGRFSTKASRDGFTVTGSGNITGAYEGVRGASAPSKSPTGALRVEGSLSAREIALSERGFSVESGQVQFRVGERNEVDKRKGGSFKIAAFEEVGGVFRYSWDERGSKIFVGGYHRGAVEWAGAWGKGSEKAVGRRYEWSGEAGGEFHLSPDYDRHDPAPVAPTMTLD
jgi:RHS repeat-associated protein